MRLLIAFHTDVTPLNTFRFDATGMLHADLNYVSAEAAKSGSTTGG